MDGDKYFLMRGTDRPGHVVRKLFCTAARNVLIGGEKYAAWRYLTKSLEAWFFRKITFMDGAEILLGHGRETFALVCGNGISHRPSPEVLLDPSKINLLSLIACNLCLFKMTVQQSSHN